MTEISSIISSIKNGECDHVALGIKEGSFVEGGPFREPVGKPGATSVVFEAESNNGSRRAIRFPKGNIPDKDHWTRLKNLSKLVSYESSGGTGLSNPTFPIAPFEVVEKAAMVEGEWIPAITMPYVEAVSLSEVVKEMSESGDREGLSRLLQKIVLLGRFFQNSDWDHGDISPGNIMVDKDCFLWVIDPDTLRHSAIPDPPVSELGHPSCAHPRRSPTEFEDDLYKFPLHSLRIQVEYLIDCDAGTHVFEDEDCILISSEDISDPRASEIIRMIGSNPSLVENLEQFIDSCEASSLEGANSMLQDFHRPKPVPIGLGSNSRTTKASEIAYLPPSRINAPIRKETPLKVPNSMKADGLTKETIVSMTEVHLRDGNRHYTALLGQKIGNRIGVPVRQVSKKLGYRGYSHLLRESGLSLKFENTGSDPNGIVRMAGA